MVEAVNSKRGRYEPVKWMANGRALMREQAEKRARRQGMGGDEILARMRALGVPIIDKRSGAKAHAEVSGTQ
jgi:DNA-binding IclR family transcriptional regulator